MGGRLRVRGGCGQCRRRILLGRNRADCEKGNGQNSEDGKEKRWGLHGGKLEQVNVDSQGAAGTIARRRITRGGGICG